MMIWIDSNLLGWISRKSMNPGLDPERFLLPDCPIVGLPVYLRVSHWSQESHNARRHGRI